MKEEGAEAMEKMPIEEIILESKGVDIKYGGAEKEKKGENVQYSIFNSAGVGLSGGFG